MRGGAAAAALATLVTAAGLVAAGVLALHILVVLLRANPANPWAIRVRQWAPVLDLGLYRPNPTTALVVGHASAAVVWVVVELVLAWLLAARSAPVADTPAVAHRPTLR